MPLAALPLLALLAAASEAPPPPPPLLEPAAPSERDPAELDPPELDPPELDPAALDPAALDPPELNPPALEPPELGPSPPPAPGAALEPAPQAAAPAGLDAWGTAAVQLAAVAGGGMLLSVPLAYGNALSLGLCGCLLYPTAISYGLVALGNAVGDREAPVLEPWLAALSVGAASSAAMWVGVLGLLTQAQLAPPNTTAPSLAGGVFIGLIAAGALCGPSASALAAVAAYHLYALPRAPGAPRHLLPLPRGDEDATDAAPAAMAF